MIHLRLPTSLRIADGELFRQEPLYRVCPTCKETRPKMNEELEQAIAHLVCQASLCADWMDDARKVWGDEAVMRRRVDMLREAIKEVKAASPPCPDCELVRVVGVEEKP